MSALPVTEKEGWGRGKNGIGPRMNYNHHIIALVSEISIKEQSITDYLISLSYHSRGPEARAFPYGLSTI